MAKFGVTDAGTELYLMEQLYDYKMVENYSVVKQAHEIQALAKELEFFPCPLPLWPAVLSPSYHLLRRNLLLLSSTRGKSSMLRNSLALLMLRRGRVQKIMGKVLSLLLPMWCRRNSTSLTRRKTRKRKRTTISPISPLNSRKLPTITRREAALFVALRNTRQVSAQIISSSKRGNQLML